VLQASSLRCVRSPPCPVELSRLVFLSAPRRRSSESLRPGDPCAIEQVAALQASFFAVSDVRRGQVSCRLVFLPGGPRRRSGESLRPGDPCVVEQVAVLQALSLRFA